MVHHRLWPSRLVDARDGGDACNPFGNETMASVANVARVQHTTTRGDARKTREKKADDICGVMDGCYNTRAFERGETSLD